MCKKLFICGSIAAVVGLVAYKKVSASRAERDLWTEATQAPDLR
jgi:hypothetical protein